MHYMHWISFDSQTDIIESVQETVLINDDDLDIIHNDSDIEIGHNVDTSVQCGPSTPSPLTNTEIAIILCNKDIDDDYEDECCDFQDELFNFE